MLIGRELEERDITTPAVIGEALGMPAAEAVKPDLNSAHAQLVEITTEFP
jgi:hypothetical protein